MKVLTWVAFGAVVIGGACLVVAACRRKPPLTEIPTGHLDLGVTLSAREREALADLEMAILGDVGLAILDSAERDEPW